ncbi:MAG: hypothetical protein AB7K09_10715 [Planctomycetota bacterium]
MRKFIVLISFLCALLILAIGPAGCAGFYAVLGLPSPDDLLDLRQLIDGSLKAAVDQGLIHADERDALRASLVEQVTSRDGQSADRWREMIERSMQVLDRDGRAQVSGMVQRMGNDAAVRDLLATADRDPIDFATEVAAASHPALRTHGDAAPSGVISDMEFVAPGAEPVMSTELLGLLIGIALLVLLIVLILALVH